MIQNNIANIKDIPPLVLEEYLRSENKGWLSSEGRQRRIAKLALLGELGNYFSTYDYTKLISYNGSADELVLPDIFLCLEGLQNSKDALYRVHKLVLNKHMKYIGSRALYSNNLREIVLNEGLLYIYDKAMQCQKLDRLIIPSTLLLLGRYSLWKTFNDGAKLYVNSDQIGIINVLEALDRLSGRLEVIFKKHREKEIIEEWSELAREHDRKLAQLNTILEERSKLARKHDRMIAQLHTVPLKVRTLKNITLKFE